MKIKKQANTEIKNKKINFLKKMYYSLFKIAKYDDLTNESMFSAIKYISKLLLIVAFILSCYVISQMMNSLNNLKSYLNENLPEMTYEDELLTVENDSRTILNDEIVIRNFKGQIIIDTITNYDDIINEYKECDIPSIILTAEHYTTIDSDKKISKYQYNDVIKQFIGENVKRIDKTELLYLFDNVMMEQYFLAYLIAEFILFVLLEIVYCLAISLIFFIIGKIKKLNLNYSKIFKITIYATTIMIFGYILLNFIPRVYAQVVVTMLPLVYLIIYFDKKIYETKN